MQENTTLVQKLGELYVKQQELFNQITVLKNEAIQVQDRKEMFHNGLMFVETMQKLIEKTMETKQEVEGVKHFFLDLLGKAHEAVPPLMLTIKIETSSSGMIH